MMKATRARTWTRVLTCCALVLLLAVAASADERANAPTATGETGLFTLFTGDTLPQGQWSFGFYLNNWDRVFAFDDRGDADWTRASASFGYGITDSWEISVMAPYDNYDLDFPPGVLVGDDSTDGFGNVRVGSKWSLFDDGARSFAINAFVEAPTGDEDALATDDPSYGAGIAYRARSWVFNLGYRLNGDLANGAELSDEILAGLGYAGTVSEQFDWITELAGTFPVDSEDAIWDDSIDLTAGGRYWFDAEGPWAFNFGLRTDVLQLSDVDEHCPIGGLIGFTYFPRAYTPPAPPPPPPPPEYQLTVDKRGDCEGTVTSSPAGIDCGATCSAVYQEGTVVQLSAAPADGCQFDGWSGDADCADGSVTLNGDRMCVASFGEIPPPPPPPAPKLTEVERTCQFGAGSARVNNACKAILDEVALLMQDNPEAPALVIGYTDASGSEESNVRMGRKRAEAVKSWLVTRHAVDPSRITVESRGEADPVCTDNTADCRKQNRRAVIRITVEEQM